MLSEEYILISKHFALETTQTDEQAVIDWRAKSQKNNQEYQHLQNLWEQTLLPPAFEPVFDERLALQKLIRKLEDSKQNVVPLATKPARVIPLLRISRWAAAAAIVLAAGYWGYQEYIYNPMLTFKNSGMVVAKNFTLPDGSVVTLEPGASVSFPKYFREIQREVNFKGEGFFKVFHNAEKPFVVDVKDAEVKVLGTSFDVIESTEGVEVGVTTGNVRLGNKKNPNVFIALKAGQRAKLKGDKVEEILPEPEPLPEPPPPPKPKPKVQKKLDKKLIYIWDGNLYDNPVEPTDSKKDDKLLN